MRFAQAIAFCTVVLVMSAHAQIVNSYSLTTTQLSSLPQSNSISKIVPRGDTIWVGSGRGLSYTADAGRSWKLFSTTETFDGKSVSAIAIRGNTIWAASEYSVRSDNEWIETGGGLHYSLDRGVTWTSLPQPVDTGKVDTLIYGRNKIPTLAVTVPQKNVTWDLTLTQNAVWTASWAGMLRKSTDQGKTWKRIVLPPDNLNHISPSDTLHFSMSPVDKFFKDDSLYNKDTLHASLNHSVFSLFASDDSTLWVGTANGINKSTDGGISWRKFNHQNQLNPISGNFVVGITEQRWKSKRIIWAATCNAVDPDEKRGVSFSTNGGETWGTALLGDFAHNIAVRDSIVYVAADGGLYRSADFGQSWTRSGTVADPTNVQRLASSRMTGTAAKGDTVWVGGDDGLAYAIDSPSQPFGTSWKVFRTYIPVQTSGRTYSYPLPFSPAAEVVRIHFSTSEKTLPVTIRIFDFAMTPVKTLLRGAPRIGSVEHDEIWDGRDDLGRRVSNGVYFYRIEIEDNDPQWGKIFVLQ
jgi:ligand-binding sensor domain-containing protein